MTTSSRVVFFGNERLVGGLKHTDAPVLSGLIERGYDVVAVVINNRDTASRNRREVEVAAIAAAHDIPVLSPARLTDIESSLRDMRPDFAVLAAYGRIIPQRIINLFGTIGIINIHPSLLPRHRGSTPIESTIVAGDGAAGVSIMQLSAGMDEGPLYAQRTIQLRGDEDKFELYSLLSHLGSELLFESLPVIIRGDLKPYPQQLDGVTYTTPLSKEDRWLDPSTETALQIERRVRAHLSFPKTVYRYNDNDVIITSAKVTPAPLSHELCITCADGSTLQVVSLIAPNGKAMSGEAYLRGLVNRRKT